MSVGGTTFTYNGTVQFYTVTVTGTYDITAFGAQRACRGWHSRIAERHQRAGRVIKSPYNCGRLTMEPTEDDREKRAQNCLAKAGYCKWVASITADKQYKDYCARLSDEWKMEAEEIRRR
jgi:hypothetical protein